MSRSTFSRLRLAKLAAGIQFVMLIALCVGLVANNVSAQSQPKSIQVLLLTGFDVKSHEWRKTSALVREVLEKDGLCKVVICEDLGILESSSLKKYDVVLLNYGFWNEPDPSSDSKQALLNYVRSGKGIVALHFACSAFQEWEEYTDVLGRVWKKGIGGHGPRGEFKVEIKDSKHPITRDMKGFHIDDELYARLSGEASIEVLATAYSEWSKKTEPIVFVQNFGKGRVVQNVLGHDLAARKHDSYQVLLRRSVSWAARR